MKLISLNTWGGKIFEPLIDFAKHQSPTTDIFCFQEIYDTSSDIKQYKNLIRANLLSEIKKILINYQVFFFKVMAGYDTNSNPVNFDLPHGPAIFVKNSIVVNDHQDYFIYKADDKKPLEKDFSNLSTPLQYINIKLNNKFISIFNFHGTPFPANKLDYENRLHQARRVRKIMDTKPGAKIIVGDFNLLPETESLKLISTGMKNLIKQFNIKRTRSNLSPYFNKPDFQEFADYTFITPDIKVLDFKVPEKEISDHLPMILEFE